MTTAGKILCLLTLGVGFGAINTGNNLLFLLLGMMLSLILASGALSEAVIRGLDARRRLPPRFVEGTPAPGHFSVENPKRYASLSVEVADRTARGVGGPAAGTTVGRETVPWWKVWKKAPETSPVGSAYTMRIDAKGTDELDARWTFDRRGRYHLAELFVVTRFPFGLFEKTRRIDAPADVVVYPAGADATDWANEVWAAFGDVPTNRRGVGEDFFGLRDYRSGEDLRSIHWKSTARRGELVVRENEALQQSEVEVLLCNWGNLPAERFESAVRKTVGLLGALSARGWRVGLRTAGNTIEPGLGQSHVDQMLAELAVVRVQRSEKPADLSTPLPRIAIGTAANLVGVPCDVAFDFEEDRR